MRKQVVLLTLFLLLSGCGGGRGVSPSVNGADLSGPVVLRYGISNPWDALMPYNSVSGSNYARIIYDKIYDRLAYVHADGTLSPRAAKSWETADGGYAAIFHLDERAAFHDGVPVTAQSWADTFRLMADPACPTLGRANLSVFTGTDSEGTVLPGQVFGAEALDDATLKLTFKVPTDPEDFLLDKNREFYVLPTHLLGGVDPGEVMNLALWQAPIGSGPCRFVEQLAGNRLTLAANRDYQLGAPGFDQLVITVMDKSNLLTALIAGDLDYYAFGGSVSAEDAAVAEQNGLEVLQGTAPNTFFELMLNCGTIPDAKVRMAIEWSLDKPLLCEQSTRGQGTPADSSIPISSKWYPYDSSLVRDRNVSGAKELLAEAGYTGETYVLACTSNRSGLAALIQQNLAETGISIKIETVDSAAMFSGMADGVYDMGIASHTPGSLPLWFLESRLIPNNNIFHVSDLSPYQELIGQIKTELDPAARRNLLKKLDILLINERPFIPLWFGTALHVQSPTVTGIDYASSSFSNENVWAWDKD